MSPSLVRRNEREADARLAGSGTPSSRALPADAADPTAPSDPSTDKEARAVPAAPSRPRRRGLALLGAILPAALVLAWVLATTVGNVPAYKLPSPGDVWTAATQLAETGQLGQFIAISVQRVLIGFAIGAVVGLLLGAVDGLSRVGEALLAPSIAAVRAVPSLAWVPLLILYLGIGEDPKIILIAIGAAFPVFTTVAGSLRHVDPQLVEAGRAYGLRRVSLFTRVQLPAVIPSLVSGLRLALAQAWLFLVAAELIASSMGLGFLLSDSQSNGRVDRMFLAIILLAVLGTLTDTVLNVLQRVLLRRWR
ncbi:sulfonate transport system permease protein [Frigoribacterium sp. PhB160]|uniref:ABC transporter permease n=1 Tax=Frigoribacterium sp. PhB160 TaxID=2485192 RepID=UPI000F4AA779|nr:ABC transporter permease [Frigoribacterium sp. PhB160]ROS62657.1 sulfonate transport system permease protein [Frigoribacterium sp. PhB160]